jgi:protein TonB
VKTSQSPARKDPPLGDTLDTSPVDDRFDSAFGGVDTSGGSRLGKPVLLGGGAILVAALVGTLFWMMGGEPDTPDSIVEPPAVASSPSITETDFVADAPAQEPVDTEALVGDALAEVEAALLESRLDEATAALQRVAELDPENARLPFLTAQLKQIQLRTYLAGARNAIRDTRFEDAANLVAAARALGLSDQAEIDVVDNELSSARSEQRVDEVLALAAARLEEGDLLRPVNDNARYYYELVLSNTPDNATARQGLNVIASKLVLQARAEIDGGNLDAAEALLADARAIDASSGELAVTTATLLAARDAVAKRERLAAEARRQEEAERIAAQERAEAERQAAAQAAADAEATGQVVADDAAAEPETAADDVAQQTVANDNGAAAATAAEQATETPTVQEPSADEPSLVAISSLTRTKYVAPKYPRAAERRGDSGWVDIVFTVAVDGTVSNVEARQSEPEGVFDRAAIRAVEKWEFEPVTEDGRPVERRVGVRMMFALE